MKFDQPPVNKEEEQFIKIPLSEEDISLSVADLGRKYNIDYITAKRSKERGYINKENPNFISNASIRKEKKKTTKSF